MKIKINPFDNISLFRKYSGRNNNDSVDECFGLIMNDMPDEIIFYNFLKDDLELKTNDAKPTGEENIFYKDIFSRLVVEGYLEKSEEKLGTGTYHVLIHFDEPINTLYFFTAKGYEAREAGGYLKFKALLKAKELMPLRISKIAMWTSIVSAIAAVFSAVAAFMKI